MQAISAIVKPITFLGGDVKMIKPKNYKHNLLFKYGAIKLTFV